MIATTTTTKTPNKMINKLITTAALILTLSACSPSTYTKISYSGPFNLLINSQQLDGATVFKSDELSIKTASGQLISGLVISHDSENLPHDFNLLYYPEYLYKLRPTKDLPSNISSKFENSYAALNATYDLAAAQKTKVNNLHIYYSCKEKSCISFITQPGITDQILSLSAENLSKIQFIELLQGFN